MKNLVMLLGIVLFLSSCGAKYTEEKVLSPINDREIENTVTVKNSLYSKTTPVTFHDPKDVENFKKELQEINSEIASNTGALSLDQIMEKARLLDYLGNTGEALELYIDNFNENMNDRSLAYSHNIAKLYEKLGENNEALKRYGFLIEYFNRPDYYKDMAVLFEKMGETEKAKKAMAGYTKAMNKKAPVNAIETQEVTVSEDGVLELK